MKNNKKIMRLLKEQERFTKTGLVKCNCGRCVRLDNITFIYPIDLNWFDWWYYIWNDDNSFTLEPNYWYGYIGYVPIVKDIVTFVYKKLHKKVYLLDIECKYCKNKE